MILNKSTKIWIYGFGQRGRMLADNLERIDLHVCGFIDRKPEMYKSMGRNVTILRPEEVQPLANMVVICTVANVFVHEEIAKLLASRGIQYIIYKSFRKNHSAEKLSLLYDDLTALGTAVDVRSREVPDYESVCVISEELPEWSYNVVCANVPAELLFGLTRQLLEESFVYKDEYLLEVLPERSLLYYTVPQKMMQYFVGEVDERAWRRWFELWCNCRDAQTFETPLKQCFDIENQKVSIEERYAIFQKMEELYQEDMRFFEKNPISVVWNEKGYFHIQDGNNRAAYLLAKGRNYIPARMSKSDYDSWMAAGEFVGLVETALDNMNEKSRAPILHPLLKDNVCTLPFYSHKKVAMVCDWLWINALEPEKLSICEFYCSNDLCGSHFARMGSKVTVVDTMEHLVLHSALDRLYCLKSVSYATRDDLQGNFDIFISNQTDVFEELKQKPVQAKWYILEFIDKEDAEIERKVEMCFDSHPQYLMRQLVGSQIYKVVVAEGKKK